MAMGSLPEDRIVVASGGEVGIKITVHLSDTE